MFPFDPPENVRKPKVDQGDQKRTLARKGLIKKNPGEIIFPYECISVFIPYFIGAISSKNVKSIVYGRERLQIFCTLPLFRRTRRKYSILTCIYPSVPLSVLLSAVSVISANFRRQKLVMQVVVGQEQICSSNNFFPEYEFYE